MRNNLIKLINNRFIYDGSSGEIFYSSNSVIEALRRTLNLPWAEIAVNDNKIFEDAMQVVRSKMEDGCFNTEQPKGYSIPSDNDVSSAKILLMTLVITEMCSLRCSYCPYSHAPGAGCYRNHNRTSMSIEVADRALDLFLKHSADNSVIGFYGGEPLLNFDLIKHVVGRIKKEKPNSNMRFTMTSNLSYMTEEIAEFLSENRVLLTISMDGPEHIHDRYRKRTDGSGSFSTLIRNLDYIREYYPLYFSECVSTNSVIASHNDLEEIDGFFSNLTPRFSVSRFSIANDSNPDFYPSIGLNPEEESKLFDKYLLDKFRAVVHPAQISKSSLLESVLKGKESSLGKPHVADEKALIPFKACIPGHKLLVKTDGTLAICDKCETLNIGDVQNGIDLDLSRQIISGWMQTLEDDCLNCWAAGFCKACYMVAWNGSGFDRNLLKSYCAAFRERTREWLEVYLPLQRKYKDFFKTIQEHSFT